MKPDYKTWTCGQCKRTVLVPSEGSDGHLDTLQRIGEHRLGHMVDTLMHGSDEDLWGLAGDDVAADGGASSCQVFGEGAEGATINFDPLSSAMEKVRGFNPAPPDPVDSDDLAPVLAGIEGLLRDDLPRARRLWYPINPDGSFNREEN